MRCDARLGDATAGEDDSVSILSQRSILRVGVAATDRPNKSSVPAYRRFGEDHSHGDSLLSGSMVGL